LRTIEVQILGIRALSGHHHPRSAP